MPGVLDLGPCLTPCRSPTIVLARDVIRPLLQRGFTVAVTRDQRKRAAAKFKVWAKENTLVTVRQAEMMDRSQVGAFHISTRALLIFSLGQRFLSSKAAGGDSWYRIPSHNFVDAFEPSLLRRSLELPEHNLGSLIFPKSWASLVADAALPASCLTSDDALTSYFSTSILCLNVSDVDFGLRDRRSR